MIGGAGKKLGKMVDLAETLYEQVTALREQLQSTTETVDETAERVERLEAEVAEQRAILEALAEAEGLDVGDIVASVDGSEAEEPAASAE